MAAHDEAPAIISDHKFEPRNEWWSLCKHCGLAMAAHAGSALDPRARVSRIQVRATLDRIGYYSDDNPDDE